MQRNAIGMKIFLPVMFMSHFYILGAHSGSYCIYRGLAVAQKKLDLNLFPNFELTEPAVKVLFKMIKKKEF